MKKILFTSLSWFFIAITAMSQGYEYETITVEEGLSQSSVTCMAQDEKGFLWFGTRDGLNRYDGQGFKVFRKIPFDTTSLGSNQITALLTYDLAGVFVGTKNGLFWHNNATQKFKNIKLTSDDASLEVKRIYRDKYDNIWVGTNNGFYRVQFEVTTDNFKSTGYLYRKDYSPRDTLIVTVSDFLHDSSNNHWIITNKGPFFIPFGENGEFSFNKDLSGAMETYSVLDQKAYSIVEHSNGYIYILNLGEIIQYDPKTKEFKSIFKFNFTPDPGINQIAEFDKGSIVLFGAFGMTLFPLKNHDAIGEPSFIPSPTFGNSQNSHRINHVLVDIVNKDLFWLATDIGGVIKMYKPNRVFNTLLLKDVQGLEIANPYVRHIIADENRIWVNLGLGILMYNKATGAYKFFDHFFLPDLKLSPTTISSFYKGSGEGFFANVEGGFFKVIPDESENLNIQYYSFDQEVPVKINTVFETPEYFLMGGGSGRVSVVDKKTYKEISALEFNNFANHTIRLLTNAVIMDSRGNLWVGTSIGLVVVENFDPKKPQESSPKYFQNNPDDPTSLIDNRITFLMEDSRKNIWICTRNGLMSAKMENGELVLNSDFPKDFQNQVIYGLLEEASSGSYWMSSNSGLYRYYPESGKVENFKYRDGLQSNEFNTWSFYQADNGEMFFGGPKGFTRFFPEDIQLSTDPPLIWFTELVTADDEKYNLLVMDKSKPLQLNFSQRSFSVNYIGLNYLNPDGLTYYYNLEGTNTVKNVALGSSRQINFSQLDPGSYTLRVSASNKDGVVSVIEDTLRFTIKGPFWRMTWFYLLVTVVVILIFWLAFYLRYRNEMKRLIAIDKVRKNISEDFHDELGSKLSIISMYSEFTKHELGQPESNAATYLDKVIDTSSRLYENTRDLIWALNPQNDTLYDLYLQLKDFGEELFQDANIDFHSSGISENLKNKDLPMRYKRHLLLIFKEGMHNALKHSGCKNIWLSIDEKDQHLVFMLQDDGTGFNTGEAYKGDGLKNMVQRAKQINGELHFISKKEGTRIWLELENKTFKK
ncbi:MAG: hypothetical protein DWQ02_17660 [Bacteroidetes bacterium]|nr:MAG: hypothetical protein DWQ02_17660 [Bacteroidota bacterium]